MLVRFFDTESTDLAGGFGRLLSYAACDLPDPGCPGGDHLSCFNQVTLFRRDQRPHKGPKLSNDRKLALAIRDHLEEADMIVGWNSILHDVPLVNARLAFYGERPIHLGEKFGRFHLDLMWYSGGQSMKIGSKRLDNVARFFHVPHQKTPLDVEVWADAAAGDADALDIIVEHNVYDALVTRDVFPHLARYVKKFTFTLSEVHGLLGEIPSRRLV